LQADVHDVVVVGGASRMTGLRDRLELMFPAHFQTSLHMTDATINAVSLSLRLLCTWVLMKSRLVQLCARNSLSFAT
jgi:hypothetical protein